MVLEFCNLNSHSGLQKLDEYLLSRSYISGYLPSKDDITVYAAVSPRHSSDFINVFRWYSHIDALLRLSAQGWPPLLVEVSEFLAASPDLFFVRSIQAMAVAFSNLTSPSGLQKLDEYLLTRSYISGYQASKDDITVYGALPYPPSSEYINISRWYKHIDALLKLSGVTESGSGVVVSSSAVEEVPASPPVSDAKAPADDDEDDDDVDLFGEETEEEKKASEARAAAAKASAKKKESGKSSVLLDVKPWDDETDMKKLEEAVRAVQLEGLTWGASKLVPVGYGIKKLQIMMTIVDDLVSIDNMIEDYLTVEPANEYVQSCDIVAFNKI